MQFEKLSETKIGENTGLVTSIREDGKVSIAQKVTAKSAGKTIEFFVKNAIEIEPKVLDDIIKSLEEAKEEMEKSN